MGKATVAHLSEWVVSFRTDRFYGENAPNGGMEGDTALFEVGDRARRQRHYL
ncbi:MAG: hypothetical protein WA913_10745 [Pricia sp.]